MALQQRSGVTDVPVAPAQVGGWTQPLVFRGVNLTWVVTTHRGSQVLRVEKLSQKDVETFDANKEWVALR